MGWRFVENERWWVEVCEKGVDGRMEGRGGVRMALRFVWSEKDE